MKEMINYDNEKGTGADSGLVFAEMAKEARNVSKTVCSNLMISKVGCIFPMVISSGFGMVDAARGSKLLIILPQ